jgi:hypothetical protein
MRITDPDPEADTRYTAQPSAISIMAKLKPTSSFTDISQLAEIDPVRKIAVNDQGLKLHVLLNSLKKA